jgi:peptidyl-prolyl isomerase D
MANFGKPHTNNSQFFMTSVECYHLDGTNVVFGHVRKGLAIVSEMETFATDEGLPTRDITIDDCGEIKPGEEDDWGYCDNDETADTLPPFPTDWEDLQKSVCINDKVDVLGRIKEAGNFFYRNEDYVQSARKYRKVTRYLNHFKDTTQDESDTKILDTIQLTNLTNLAACELKLHDYEDVRFSCNAAIKIDPNNIKAYYRRGLANLELKNYEAALDDLKMALKLSPNNKAVISEFERAKKFLLSYRAAEKTHYKKMFQ